MSKQGSWDRAGYKVVGLPWNQLRNHVGGHGEYVGNWVWDCVSSQVSGHVENQVWSEIGGQIRGELENP